MATDNFKLIVKNNKAHFDYFILDRYEAGILLTGSEVKSIRHGKISIKEAFIGTVANTNHLYLLNANISKYDNASYNNHYEKRNRILLLHQSQKSKLINAIQKKGLTIVPISVYFNNKGIIKLEIGLARGKNVVDKRETIKRRQWNIEKNRLLKF